MNIWNEIDEPITRAMSGIVYSIWGGVGFGVGYIEDTKEIHIKVWDRSYRCDDKEIVVDKKFNYEIKNTDTSTILGIVEMIEKYLIENYS